MSSLTRFGAVSCTIDVAQLGTANALKNGGPLGLLLGYAAMGTVCYSVMISLGAMISYLPISGGHIRVSRFDDMMDRTESLTGSISARRQICRPRFRICSRMELVRLAALGHPALKCPADTPCACLFNAAGTTGRSFCPPS